MKLDLTEIVAHSGKQIRYHIEEPAMESLGGALTCVSSIAGDVAFTNSGRHIVTRGYFHATIELDCSRCLSRYRMQMDIPIEEELPIPGHAIQPCPESEEDEFAEEEIEPLFVDGIFDLTELLRQSILVAVPIKPLCSEECRGLCVHCGKNLNDGPCNCPSDIEPGPFEALAQLAEEQENEET